MQIFYCPSDKNICLNFQVLSHPEPVYFGNFGRSVNFFGNRLLVSCQSPKKIYIFERPSRGQQFTLVGDLPYNNHGHHLRECANRLMIMDVGEIHIYNATSLSFVYTMALDSPNTDFGSFDCYGDWLIEGARNTAAVTRIHYWNGTRYELRDTIATGKTLLTQISNSYAAARRDATPTVMIQKANPDVDSDGVVDCQDSCPADNPDDSDSDSVCESLDACWGDDITGDSDADLVCDDSDPCPFAALDDQDSDTICDDQDDCVVGDLDSDNECDNSDFCWGSNESQDLDSDGVCGDLDTCPLDSQDDVDSDGYCGDVDACEGDDNSGDSDSDGLFCDDLDHCFGASQSDWDWDGLCDEEDK